MDPARPSHHQSGRRRRRDSPERVQESPRSPTVPYHSRQPSLPSIRQLHPYLSYSEMPPHSPIGEGPSYSYPPPPVYPPPLSGNIQATHSTQVDRLSHMQSSGSSGREPEQPGTAGGESDGEGDQQGPPKKKRRRQALSCTECKRRKIKCDRKQPCGPCTRRGEQNKCQWHVVEPIEKYVTRAEYNDLKSRFDRLEAVVQLLSQTPGAPIYQIGLNPAVTPSGVPAAAEGPPLYQSGQPHPIMHSPQEYSHRGESSQSLKPPGPRYRQIETSALANPALRPHDQQPSSASSNVTVSSSPTVLTHRSSPLPRIQPPELKSPMSASKQKSSPLSLASITSPFTPHPNIPPTQGQGGNQNNQHLQPQHSYPDAHPKNCHAQTLMSLGERLRPHAEGPAARLATLVGVSKEASVAAAAAPCQTSATHIWPTHMPQAVLQVLQAHTLMSCRLRPRQRQGQDATMTLYLFRQALQCLVTVLLGKEAGRLDISRLVPLTNQVIVSNFATDETVPVLV